MARMRMGRARLTLAAVLLAVAGVSEAADDWGGWRDRVTLTLSDRLRGELVDWFQPRAAPRGAGRYGFFASRLPAARRPPRPRGALRPPHAPDDAGRAVPEARVRHPPAERPLAHGRAVRVRRRPRDRAGEPDARVPETLPSGGAPGGAVLVLARVAELRRRSRVV